MLTYFSLKQEVYERSVLHLYHPELLVFQIFIAGITLEIRETTEMLGWPFYGIHVYHCDGSDEGGKLESFHTVQVEIGIIKT